MWADGIARRTYKVDYECPGALEYIEVPAAKSTTAPPMYQNSERDPSWPQTRRLRTRSGERPDRLVAWPLYHTIGKRHVGTATVRPGGRELTSPLSTLLPALALVSAILVKNRLRERCAKPMAVACQRLIFCRAPRR